MRPVSIKQQLIHYANTLQIDTIGFCSAEPFEQVREILQSRATNGYLSGFEEPDIEKRIDPKKTLKDVKTIIVIGMGYHKIIESCPSEGLRGRLSKSAWGVDYHSIMKDKLYQLGLYLLQISPGHYEAFADTGPLVDREVAKRAGLGWQGKHCGIISPTLGSWFFIGYILTDIEIEKDEPLEGSRCGSCTRCQKACPTNALQGDYALNSKRCISYLTQVKEDISPELMEKMGLQIYGCDICQSVCPYNQGISPVTHPYFVPECVEPDPILEDLLEMSNQQFKNTYGLTAAGWRGKKTLQRNGIIALGNSKDIYALDLLAKYIIDARPIIRKAAAWAVGNLGFKEGIPILIESQNKEEDMDIHKVISQALVDLQSKP